MRLRASVRRFAELMECKLQENDHKGGWSNETPGDLLDRLFEETAELNRALASPIQCKHDVPPIPKLHQRDTIGREAADVANFAMMIADVCGALRRK